MKYNTDRWYYIMPFWCKFTSKTEGWTACGRTLKLTGKTVSIPTEIMDIDNSGNFVNEIIYKQIN